MAYGIVNTGQRPADYYTKTQSDTLLAAAVAAHNGSLTAHPYLSGRIDSVESAVELLKLQYGTNVTENAFSVTFDSLDGLAVSGVYNSDAQRIEFGEV